MRRKARWSALPHFGLMACITFGCAKKVETPSSAAIVAAVPAAPATSPTSGVLDRATRAAAGDGELLSPSNKRHARTASNRRGLRTQVAADKLNDVNQLWLIGNGRRG